MTRRLVAAAVSLAIASATWAAAPPGVDRAVALFKAGKYLDAASDLQAIVDRSPGYAYGYFLLGHCYLKTHQLPQAQKNFRRAIDLDPSQPEYYKGLALATQASSDWEETIRAATDGLGRTQDPNRQYALLALRGYALGALQRWDGAIADLEAARRLSERPWVLILLGKAYFASQRFFSAIPPLLAALKYAPEDPSVLRLLAESYVRAGGQEPDSAKKKLEYEAALGYAQRLTSVAPNDLDAINLVGRAALGSGRLPQAEQIFLHVLSQDGRQCYAMVNLGRTYIAAERWSDAETVLRKATACAPRMGVVYETLGDLFLKTGRSQEAAEAFARAEQLDSGDQGMDDLGIVPRRAPETTPVFNPR